MQSAFVSGAASLKSVALKSVAHASKDASKDGRELDLDLGRGLELDLGLGLGPDLGPDLGPNPMVANWRSSARSKVGDKQVNK